MLVLYTLICIVLLFYALLTKSYVYNEMHRHFHKFFHLNTGICKFFELLLNSRLKNILLFFYNIIFTGILIFLTGFILLMIFFCYSTLLFLYEYQFVAEIDRFLKSIKRSSSQNSKEQEQPNITVIGNNVGNNKRLKM